MSELKEDDELTIVETETLPDPEEQAAAAAAAEADDEDDEDDVDERLAGSEDDHEEEIVTGSKNRDRRIKRRDAQRQARERSEREIAALRRQNEELANRLTSVERQASETTEASLDRKIEEAANEFRQAEYIIAKATEAGNGEDVAAAMRIRDDATRKFNTLTTAKQQVAQARQQAAQPRVNPAVVNYAQQWIAANPWYDHNGRDEDSRITKAIDDGLGREGYDAATPEYWQELTRRVSARLNGNPEPAGQAPEQRRRKAPPTGGTRENVPASTRNEVYVTPERKQAMMDAGVWDDPVARKRYLQSYATYDKSNSAR